jgi:hypothetical protein
LPEVAKVLLEVARAAREKKVVGSTRIYYKF